MDEVSNTEIYTSAAGVRKLYDIAVGLRQNARFGEAINMFMRAADESSALLSRIDAADHRNCSDCAPEDIRNALLQIRSRAKASVELLQEINGFVNTDLMNP